MSEKEFARSSLGISSDKSHNSSSASSTQQQDDSISISSIKGPYEIPEEIKYGPANFFGKICLHSKPCHFKEETLPKLYSALDWERQLRDLGQEVPIDSSVANIYLRCSKIFIRRLNDIEENAAFDLEAKLQIYKDWVSVLIKFNESIFEDLELLENALSDLQRATRAYAYLVNSRRDFSTLSKLISYFLYQRRWTLVGIEFKTLHTADVMGLNERRHYDKKILRKLKRGELSNRKVECPNKYI